VITTRSQSRRRPRRRVDHTARNRRLAGLGLAISLTLLLGARMLGSGHSTPPQALAAPPRVAQAPDGPPQLESLASAGSGLTIDVPVRRSRITAIVYHGVGSDGSIPLVPSGHQRNAGLLTTIGNLLAGSPSQTGPQYYVDSGGAGDATGSVDVGAVAGTGVYSPIDGRVVSIRPYVINGRPWGSVIQIQPSAAPALIVTLTNLVLAPAIQVGAPVAAGQTRLGSVADLSKALSQVMAKYSSDAGNHVHVEVSQAPASIPLL
jgi:hypothetical protein